jgi:Flp pilus assembly pilin Flp
MKKNRTLQTTFQKKSRSGQTLVEYALILAFISVVAIIVLQQLGSKVSSVFSTVNSKLSTAAAGS